MIFRREEVIYLDSLSRYNLANSYEEDDITKYELLTEVDIDTSDPLTYHTCTSGDNLRTISYKYYGTTKLWWALAYANKIIDPTNAIKNGSVLTIPKRRYIPL